MTRPFKVWAGVYQVGGSFISDPADCSVFLVNTEPNLVLIDSGAGRSFRKLLGNIKELGFNPENLKAIITTHAHIDHVGSHAHFKEHFNVTVVAHKLDAEKIESGKGIGAELYGLPYKPCRVDVKLDRSEDSLRIGSYEFKILHIPGHTPGSIACYLDVNGKRVLFGQDIHGPYAPEWGANIEEAIASLKKLIGLKADILCEGHFGIYQPASRVKGYIEAYLRLLEARLKAL